MLADVTILKLMPKHSGTFIEVSSESFQRLKTRCGTLGLNPDTMGDDLVAAWLKQNHEALEQESASALAAQLRRGLMAERFFEGLPNEACIKDSSSRIVWANDLFIRMSGKSGMEELWYKKPGEIWTSQEDQKRVQDILQWDQRVVTTQKPFCHVDAVRHGDRNRYRLGIRFPVLFSNTREVLLIGSLGIDFATEEDARKAHETLRLSADWIAL